MTDKPVYDSVKSCPKCKYTPDTRSVASFKKEFRAEYRIGKQAIYAEAIRRRCPMCGYHWEEQCADAEGTE